VISEIRVAAASLAAFPARLYQTEAALLGKRIDAAQLIRRARRCCRGKPIDDIRSTAEYRKRVAANLLEEFLIRARRGGSAA
jgi:xanthine dehydrogenase iron-sulfur cluster and FAD-binding subunit A